MRLFRLIIASIALLAAPFALPATAQDAPPAASDTASDPYERFYDTLNANFDYDAYIDSMMVTVREQFAAQPTIAAADQASPGLIDDLMVAIRPVMKRYSLRVRAEYRPRMVAVMRENLTVAEIEQITAFYQTPIGLKMLDNLTRTYRPEKVMGTIDEGRAVTAQDVEQDLRANGRRSVDALTKEERAELIAVATKYPAIAKLGVIGPKIAAIRAEMEEAPTNADEEAEMRSAIEAVFKRRLGK